MKVPIHNEKENLLDEVPAAVYITPQPLRCIPDDVWVTVRTYNGIQSSHEYPSSD